MKQTMKPTSATTHWLRGLFFAILLLTSAVASARDGDLDTNYIINGSGYHQPGRGEIPIYPHGVAGTSTAMAYLLKSDGSAVLVGKTYDPPNQIFGIGVAGVNAGGELGYQPQCSYVTHECFADGASFSHLSPGWSLVPVLASLIAGDTGPIRVVGRIDNVLSTFFVANILDAHAQNNSMSPRILTNDFNDPSTNYKVTSAAYDSSDRLYVAGYLTNALGNLDFFVARYRSSPTFAPDTSFGSHAGLMHFGFDIGGSKADIANAIAIQPDGKIVLVGTTATGASTYSAAIARLTTAGALDTSFGIGGKQTIDFFAGFEPGGHSFGNAVALRDDGSILVGGAAYRPAHDAVYATQYAAISRLQGNGSYPGPNEFGHGSNVTDNAFVAGDGITVLFHYIPAAVTQRNDVTSRVSAITVQPNGRILLAGSGSALNGGSFFGISRLERNGNPDTSFGHTFLVGFPPQQPTLPNSTRTYNFIDGMNIGSNVTTNTNTDFAYGILSTPKGIYVYGQSTIPNAPENDLGYIRLHNDDAIFANSFGVLPPGG